MKLSEAQERALGKLTGQWQSAYELQLGLNTLDSLVRKNLVEINAGIGALWFPRTEISYRLKNGEGR